MPQRYGTRSTTKAACSRAPFTGNPLASEHLSLSTEAVPLAGNSRHNPEAAEAAPPPCANSGRRPLIPPASFQLAEDGGHQRGQEPSPATLMLPAKRALVHKSATPPSATSASEVAVTSMAGTAGAAAAQVGAENNPPSGAAQSRRKRSRLSLGLGKRRASPPQQTVAAPAVLTPIGDGSRSGSRSSGAIVGCFPGGISPRLGEGSVGSAKHPQRTSPPPPPPFVGLKNAGETCFVNAVLQALVACRNALRSSRGAAGAAEDGGKAGDRQGEGEGTGSSSAAPVHEADDVGLSSVGTVSTRLRAGADGNPVFVALSKVLEEMEARNRMLFQQQQQQQQQQSPEVPVEQPSTDPAIPVLVGDGSPEMPMCPSDQTPLRPGVSTREENCCAGAIAPNALVELIRDGWLSEERAAGGVTATTLLRRLEGGRTAGVGDFGNGQACVSELLGKLLDVCVALGDAPSGSVGGERTGGDSGVCGLATAFRGVLCARTHCMECERDRTSRDEFTELALPPLVLPPSPKLAAVQGAGAAAETSSSRCHLSKPLQEVQTLQRLVDAVLGRESLEGSNKVWCEACRQWNEAERRSSLCSPPGLLALHVRPGARKQSSPCPYPSAAIVAAGGALRKQADGAVRAGGRGCPRKTEQGRTASGRVNDEGKVIERVLVVKSASRCQSHAVDASENGSASSSVPARKSEQPRAGAEGEKGHHRPLEEHRWPLSDSGDVFYDLIGAILHQGQTLGSGHYTFALHASSAPSRLKDQPPTHHDHDHPPSAGERSSASCGTECSPSSAGGGTDRENPGSMGSGQRLIGEVEAGGSVAAGCKKPGFALFDDDVVRWLSLEEESAVLRGGGGAVGDPFLVFYARRA